MPLTLTPRLLRRGLELFAVISFFGVVVVLVFFGQDLEAFLGGLTHLHLVWLIIGLALASMDWFGGGTRLWVVARHVHPGVRWRDAVRWLATRAEHKSGRVAARLEQLREGIDRAHECLVAFGSPRGWLALLWAVLLSGPSHANKLLAGYVALRTLGLHTNFVDILLLQTFITFLLYFAPTPGSSGLAELLSAAVMQIYVQPAQLPTYTLIWRFINSYATVIVGSLLFWHWLKRGLVGREESVAAEGVDR